MWKFPAVATIFLLLATAVSSQSQTGRTQPTPEPSITLDQMRELYRAQGYYDAQFAETTRQQLIKQKKDLPPWWPESVFAEEINAGVAVDQTEIAFPFYRSCYSERDARLFIHLFQTPEGNAYIRRLTATQLVDQVNGSSAVESRANMLKKDPGLPQSVLKGLDTEDQRHAKEVFGTNHMAEITACGNEAVAKASVAVRAEQIASMKAVIQAHNSELQAAKAKYTAEQTKKPQN